jgi:membrane protein implicated in regulation of membrane protease activity
MDQSTAGGCLSVCWSLELLTGTFYLLMLAWVPLPARVAPIWAWAPAARSSRGPGRRRCRPGLLPAAQAQPAQTARASNRDVNLDVGETVVIEQWNTDGTAQVRYRGATWTVMGRQGAPPSRPHRVAEVMGNRLLVDKI